MTPFLWAVLIILLGQFPAYLARETLRLAILTIGTSLGKACRIAYNACKIAANNATVRNRKVLLMEDQLKNQHNLRRRYGRLRDAHIRDLALLPDYFRQVEDVMLSAREERLSVREIARLADLTRRLEQGADKVLQAGYKLDAWVKRQKLDEATSEHVLTASIYRTTITAFLTVTIAMAAVFVNFNLIALPMGELVPADQMVAGVSVATISAGVIVLLELVVGIFLLEALGITRLFNFDALATWQVRVIGAVALLGLLFLASTEATLAVMREQIVAADAALKAGLVADKTIAPVERSLLPMYGQAALGFSLPWIIAMVGIPLELAVEASRQVFGRILVFVLRMVELVLRLAYYGSGIVTSVLIALLHAYVAIPTWLSTWRSR
jgi:hypothetical protein